MAENATVQFAAPADIRANPENPRLIFHDKELQDLASSIASNGILVPLTVYQERQGEYVLLDGERRWRCARKLGLTRVPVIVQPKPSRMQNLMMMFAIHNARTDWDPFPTALKLRELEKLFEQVEGRTPTETQLAQLASLARGEVRRLKNILALPEEHLELIKTEQELPRAEQTVTVDHLLELTRGSRALTKRDVLNATEARLLERALISKFRTKVLTSTVEPRLLSRMARGLDRGEVSKKVLRDAVTSLIHNRNYSVSDAFRDTVQRSEVVHNLANAVSRLRQDLVRAREGGALSEDLMASLRDLRVTVDSVLADEHGS